MPNDANAQYLLSVKWDDSVHRPNAVIHHRLVLPKDLSRAEFESQMMETVLPELKKTKTRAGAVTHVALYRHAENAPGRFLELDAPLPKGVVDEVGAFEMVAEL